MTRQGYIERLVTGGFPEAVSRSPDRRRAWFTSYLTTGLRRIAQRRGDDTIADISRLARLCATRSATEINLAKLSSELGWTVHRTSASLDLLSDSFIVQLLPAWSTNVSAKVVRRPKLYLVDSGLAAHAVGSSSSLGVDPRQPLGPLMETFVAMEIRRQLSWSREQPTMWHFRDRSGVEVDIVLEHPDGRVVGIEVKASSSVGGSDFRGLRFLEERLGSRFHLGVVLHTAPESVAFGPKLTAMPISALWE